MGVDLWTLDTTLFCINIVNDYLRVQQTILVFGLEMNIVKKVCIDFYVSILVQIARKGCVKKME